MFTHPFSIGLNCLGGAGKLLVLGEFDLGAGLLHLQKLLQRVLPPIVHPCRGGAKNQEAPSPFPQPVHARRDNTTGERRRREGRSRNPSHVTIFFFLPMPITSERVSTHPPTLSSTPGYRTLPLFSSDYAERECWPSWDSRKVPVKGHSYFDDVPARIRKLFPLSRPRLLLDYLINSVPARIT